VTTAALAHGHREIVEVEEIHTRARDHDAPDRPVFVRLSSASFMHVVAAGIGARIQLSFPYASGWNPLLVLP
jgi:hypothetical protein